MDGRPLSRATGHAATSRSAEAKAGESGLCGRGKIAAAKDRRASGRVSISPGLRSQVSISHALISRVSTGQEPSGQHPRRHGSMGHGLLVRDLLVLHLNAARSGLRIVVAGKGSGSAGGPSREDSLAVSGLGLKRIRSLSGRSAVDGPDFRLRKCSRARSFHRARVDRNAALKAEVQIVGSGPTELGLRGSIGSVEASGAHAKAENGRRGPRAELAEAHGSALAARDAQVVEAAARVTDRFRVRNGMLSAGGTVGGRVVDRPGAAATDEGPKAIAVTLERCSVSRP